MKKNEKFAFKNSKKIRMLRFVEGGPPLTDASLWSRWPFQKAKGGCAKKFVVELREPLPKSEIARKVQLALDGQ